MNYGFFAPLPVRPLACLPPSVEYTGDSLLRLVFQFTERQQVSVASHHWLIVTSINVISDKLNIILPLMLVVRSSLLSWRSSKSTWWFLPAVGPRLFIWRTGLPQFTYLAADLCCQRSFHYPPPVDALSSREVHVVARSWFQYSNTPAVSRTDFPLLCRQACNHTSPGTQARGRTGKGAKKPDT